MLQQLSYTKEPKQEMKKILFIRTTYLDKHGGSMGVAPPLGLMYLASAVSKEFRNTYETRIIDMKLHNLSLGRVKKIISEFKPDILGCSVCSDEDRCMHEIANMSKAINRDCKVIVGGPHPTMYYKDILQNRNIDVAVIGEGERTFIELLNYFKNDSDIRKTLGIAFRQGEDIIFTRMRPTIDNLDSLSFPAWNLIDFDAYS